MNQQPNPQPNQQPDNESDNSSSLPTTSSANFEEQLQAPSEITVPFAPVVPPLPPTEPTESAAESNTLDFSASKPEMPEQDFDFSTGPIVMPGAPESLPEQTTNQSDAAEFQSDATNAAEMAHAEPEATPNLPADEVPPPAPPEKSNLAVRVITALIGIPIVALLVWRADAALFNLVVAFLALLGLRELSKALRAAQMPLIGSLAYPALIALLFVQPLTVNYPRWGGLIIWVMPFLLMVLLLITSVLRYPSSRRISLQAIALTLFATLYAGLFVFLILLRSLRTGPLDFLDDAPRLGYSLLWLTILSVWAGDIVAYFAGQKHGKKKLTPLSPGKSWEGAVAGLAATFFVCVPIATRLQFELHHAIALGILIALAAPLGDLAESFWKRELAIKDMGGVLPGHGGILDRCDSLLFAAFVVYLYAQIWMI